MGGGNWLADAVNALTQGMAYQKYGIDYKQKQALGAQALDKGTADIAHTQAETGQAQAQTGYIGAEAGHVGAQTKLLQDQLQSAEEEKQAADAAYQAGGLNSPVLKVHAAIAEAKRQAAQNALDAAQTADTTAQIPLRAAQAANERIKYPEEEKIARIHADAMSANKGSAPQFALDPATNRVRWFQRGELDQTPGAQPKPSAADASVSNQGNKILQLRDNLLTTLQDPGIASHLGPYAGRVNALEQMKGDPDPNTQMFVGELESYLEMQGKLHGLRGQRVADNFRSVINANHFTPAALAAGIRGVAAASEAFAGTGAPRNNANDVLPPGPGSGGANPGPRNAGGGAYSPAVQQRLQQLGIQ